MRLVLLLCSLLSLTSTFASAEQTAREIKVKGKDEFTVRFDGNAGTLSGPQIGSATLRSTPSGFEIVQKGSVTSASKNPKDELEIKSGSEITYRIVSNGEVYRVGKADGTPIARVKIKEDKFNVYGADDVRLYHGKEKEDGYKVKDETDATVWKIAGPRSLKEASPFALPLDPTIRVVVWAALFAQ